MVRIENKSSAVLGAWRIYHDVIDQSQTRTPLAFLRAFADMYGFPTSIRGPDTAKFHYYEIVPAQSTVNPTELLTVHAPQDSDFETNMIVRPLTQGIIEIAVAFAIDRKRYASDIQKFRR
jgi:hypothetical protein